jgi:hypothetical protein
MILLKLLLSFIAFVVGVLYFLVLTSFGNSIFYDYIAETVSEKVNKPVEVISSTSKLWHFEVNLETIDGHKTPFIMKGDYSSKGVVITLKDVTPQVNKNKKGKNKGNNKEPIDIILYTSHK